MKKLIWIGSSKKDVLKLPKAVIQEFGYALHLAQAGDFYFKIKPFKGFGNGIFEVATEHESNAYRLIYSLQIKDYVYALHAFHKKSKQGIKTPKEEVNIIKKRINILRREKT